MILELISLCLIHNCPRDLFGGLVHRIKNLSPIYSCYKNFIHKKFKLFLSSHKCTLFFFLMSNCFWVREHRVLQTHC
uniref:Uncharacterized protein n=1 Tax=Rhizophora mucronata TaxID=61149 RepID=A0A2P2NRW1_RHIMU